MHGQADLQVPHKSLSSKPELFSSGMHCFLVLIQFILVGQVAQLWLLSNKSYILILQLLLFSQHLGDLLTHALRQSCSLELHTSSVLLFLMILLLAARLLFLPVLHTGKCPKIKVTWGSTLVAPTRPSLSSATCSTCRACIQLKWLMVLRSHAPLTKLRQERIPTWTVSTLERLSPSYEPS